MMRSWTYTPPSCLRPRHAVTVTRCCAGLGMRAVAARGREKGDASTTSTMYDSLCQLIGLKSPGGTADAKSSGQTGRPEKAGEGEDKTKQVLAVATEVVSKEDLQTKRLRVVFSDEAHVPERGAGDADAAVESSASHIGATAGASAAGAAAKVATNSTDRDLLQACVKIYNVYMQAFENELAGDGTSAALTEDAAAVTEVKAKAEEEEKKGAAVTQGKAGSSGGSSLSDSAPGKKAEPPSASDPTRVSVPLSSSAPKASPKPWTPPAGYAPKKSEAAQAEARAGNLKDSVKPRVGTTRRAPPPVPRVSEGVRQERAVGKSAGKSTTSGGVGSSSGKGTSTAKTMLQYQMTAVTAE